MSEHDPAPEFVPAPAPAPITGDRHKRPWPMVAVLLMLLVQVIGLAVQLALHLEVATGLRLARLPFEVFVELALRVASLTFALLVLIAVSLFAILSNLRRWRNAWAHAMLAEGLLLLVGLLLYFNARPATTWFMLAYGVFVVVYLILPGVQAAFLPGREART